MPRETARSKAVRLLLEGRLQVLEVSRYGAFALVRGEGHQYRAAWEFGRWTCTCAARTDACSHLLALKRVVAVDLPERRSGLTG